MASKYGFTFFFGICVLINVSQQSRHLYSLQPAVDALNEQEVNLLLQKELETDTLETDYGNFDNAQKFPVYHFSNDYEEFEEKRSGHKKRNPSVFRERTREPGQQVLAAKFLRAIESERANEENLEYQKQLRELWNSYQSEEGNLEKELFEYEENFQPVDRAVKQHGDKRSMPLLPWLPAKRFPVTKRSAKESQTSESKTSQDLTGIFGKDKPDGAMKKKRSYARFGDIAEKKSEIFSSDMQGQKIKKRDVEDVAEDEADEENDGSEEGDAEAINKKKKREVVKNSKHLKTGDHKTFAWSDIFGIDRKKKSLGMLYHPLVQEDDEKRTKRCEAQTCDGEDYNEYDYEDEDNRRKKKDSRQEKLNEMDLKLKKMQNLIFEDAAKFYGALGSLKNQVANAYRLEKMRNGVAHLKQSVEFENNFDYDKKKMAKRVAFKKDKAEFEGGNDHDVDLPEKLVQALRASNSVSQDEIQTEKRSQCSENCLRKALRSIGI